jgi:hypothetical protein
MAFPNDFHFNKRFCKVASAAPEQPTLDAAGVVLDHNVCCRWRPGHYFAELSHQYKAPIFTHISPSLDRQLFTAGIKRGHQIFIVFFLQFLLPSLHGENAFFSIKNFLRPIFCPYILVVHCSQLKPWAVLLNR